MKLTKHLPKPFLVMTALLAGTLACTSAWEYERIQTQQAGTQVAQQDAIATLEAALTAESPTQEPLPAATQECDFIAGEGTFGEGICVQIPELRGEIPPILPESPFEGGTERVDASPGRWPRYYNEEGERLGQLRPGSVWPAESGWIVLTGWVPDRDLELPTDEAGNLVVVEGTTKGEVHCRIHSEGHVSGPLCHAHIFDGSGDELATIPLGMVFTVTGGVSGRMVPNSAEVVELTQGRVVTFEEKVKVGRSQ